MHKPESLLENEVHTIHWDFVIQTDHLISARRLDLVKIKKKKRTCQIVNLDIPVDYGGKIKENENRDKYLNLAREQKKLWNINVTVILLVIGVLRTIPIGLIRELEELKIGGRSETIHF